MAMSIEELLKKDKEKFIHELEGASSLKEAADMTGQEIDRLLYRFSEDCKSEEEATLAAAVLGAVRPASAFIDSAGKVSTWEKNYSVLSEEVKGKKSVFFYIFLAVGIASAITALLFIAFDLHSSDVRFHTSAFILLLLSGFACLFMSGRFSNKKPEGKSKSGKQNEVITEIAPDPEKIYHSLLGVAITADHVISRAGVSCDSENKTADAYEPGSRELDLHISLLENAYALYNSSAAGSLDSSAAMDSAGETISQIRYYMHLRGIEALEYSEENKAYFDIMPSAGSGTLRPALCSDNRLIKKGLAAGK